MRPFIEMCQDNFTLKCLWFLSISQVMWIFSYNGKGSNELLSHNSTLDTHCTITTKTVMGLLEKTKLLDNTEHFSLPNNYLKSLQVLDDLRYCDLYGCGTVSSHCKGLPKAVVSKKIKLKKGEAVF